MTDVEFILAQLELEASQHDALQIAHLCRRHSEAAEGERRADLHQELCLMLRAVRADVAALIAKRADARAESAEAGERTLFISNIMYRQRAAVVEPTDVDAVVAAFEAAHRTLIEQGLASWELARVTVPARLAGEESQVTFADVRWVFIGMLMKGLDVSIHNTEAELRAKSDAFEHANRLPGSRIVTWNSHQIVIPPATAAPA